MRFFQFSLFFLFALTAGAKNYYISSSGGDDANSGDAPANALKSIAAVNEMMLQPGDTIFFRRGDVFRGQLVIRQSGTEQQPLVITAYGTGAPPVIKGSEAIETTWTLYKDNIYKAILGFRPWFVFVNDQWHSIARSPNNNQFYPVTQSTPQLPAVKTIGVGSLKGMSDLTGAYVTVQTSGSTIVTRMATGFNAATGELTLDQDRRGDSKEIVPGYETGYGVILSNKLQFLDAPREFYYDTLQREIYLQCFNNAAPDGLIEGSVYDYGVKLSGRGIRNVVISMIDFRQQRMAGIFLPDGSEGITIDHCHFTSLPDATIADQNSSNNSNKLQFTNNVIRDAFKTGVVLGNFTNGKITGNDLFRCGVNVNMAEWMNLSGNYFSSACGIYGNADHSEFSNNRIDSVGHSGIAFGSKNYTHNLVLHNSVSGYCLNYFDGGGIYCNRSNGTVISENEVRDAAERSSAMVSASEAVAAVYLNFPDKTVNDSVQVTGNNLHNGQNGIWTCGFVNSAVIRRNTIYNMEENAIGFYILTPGAGKITTPVKISSNSIYCLAGTAAAVSFVNEKDPMNTAYNFAASDSNFYFFFANEGAFRLKSMTKIDEHPDAAKWKTRGFDAHSNFTTASALAIAPPVRTGKNLVADSACSADPKANGWSSWPGTVKISKATDARFTGNCVKADFLDKSAAVPQSVAIRLTDPATKIQSVAVTGGASYLLEFDALATAGNEFELRLLEDSSNVPLFTGARVQIGTVKKTYRVLVTPKRNGRYPILELSGMFEKSFSVFFDNVRFYPVQASYTSPVQVFPLFTNETDAPKTITLNGSCYVQLDGTPAGETITVPPYGAMVLRSSCSAPVRAIKGRGH